MRTKDKKGLYFQGDFKASNYSDLELHPTFGYTLLGVGKFYGL